MRELRWISADAYAAAINAPLGLKRGSYGTPSSSPFVFDQVRQELNARLPAKLAARGGLRVYSTVDQRLQFAARRAIKDVLKSPGDPSAALVAINVHNGNVLALGTSDYGSAKNQFNLATAGHRSPGSTFKLFALVDALRRGADPSRVYYPSGYVSFPEDDPICPQPGGWSPHNADGGGGGYLSLESATVHSVNVVYAQLMRDLTPKRVAATAHLLGIRSKLPLHCSMVLGADDVTPLELTSAYATIAAGGVYHRPRTIRRVEDADGQDRGRARSSASRPSASSATASPTRPRRSSSRPCQRARARGRGSTTGGRRRARPARPRTTATPGSAATRPTSRPACGSATARSNKPLENVEGFGAVYGGTIPAMIWKDFMTTAHARIGAARLAGAQASDGLQGLRGDDVVRLQPGAAGGARGAGQEAEEEASRSHAGRADDAGRDRPAERLSGVTA